MVNFTSVFVCFKYKNRGDPLLPQKKDEPQGLSATASAGIAFVVILIYLAIGTATFYFLQYESQDNHWSVVDALYFSVVTVSTVGYGDLTPSSSVGKWIDVVYMFFGIAMIGLALGTLGGFILERQEALLIKAMSGKSKGKSSLLGTAGLKILGAILVLITFLGIGVVSFFFLEDLSATDAVFLTVQTVTTVGYGSPTINSQAGRAFAIPYILLSTLLVAGALGTFADVFMERRQEKIAERILKAEFDLEAILAMDTDGDQQIDMAEFMEFMLVKMGKVSSIDMERVKNQFRELDADGSGVLDNNDIKIMQQRALAERNGGPRNNSTSFSIRSVNSDSV